MKLSLRKNLLLAFLIALPLVLFAMLRDKASWRPQLIAAPVYGSGVDISSDDHWFVRFGDEDEVFLSNLPDRKIVKQWKTGHSTWLLKFSPDGKVVAVAWAKDDNINTTLSLGVTLCFANGIVREMEPLTRNLASDRPYQLRFSPDGETLWLASTQNLRAWDLSSGKLQWQWHNGDLKSYTQANSVAISKDCRFCFRQYADNYQVWDIIQKKSVLQIKNPRFYIGLEFSPDASLASYPDDNDIFQVVMDTRSGRVLWRDAEKFRPVFAGDKATFFQGNKFKVCDARTGKFLYKLPAKPQSTVISMSSNDWLYSADNENAFRQRFR